MSEMQAGGEEHIQQVIARFEELSNQCRMSQDRADQFLAELEDRNPQEADIGLRGFEAGGELQKRATDFNWAMALREVGIPAIVIRKIWDKKDAMARQDKDTSSMPPNSQQ